MSTEKDEGCFAITFERKYYRRGNAFVKRCLRPREFRVGYQGLYVPRLRKERLKNEAHSLQYIRRHTNIPVPELYCDFEDDDAYYLVMEYVEGVGMSELAEDQKPAVLEELKSHLAELKVLTSLSSNTINPAPYQYRPFTMPETKQDKPSGETNDAGGQGGKTKGDGLGGGDIALTSDIPVDEENSSRGSSK